MMKCQPKVWKARRPPHSIDRAAPPSTSSTSVAAPTSIHRNRLSCRVSLAERSRAPTDSTPSGGDTVEETVIPAPWRVSTGDRDGRPASRATPSLLDLDRTGPVCLDLLDQRIRQGDVIERLGLRLALLEGPLEKIERGLAAGGVFRLLVHQHEGAGRDRPGVRSRRVGDHQVKVLDLRPVGPGGRSLERLQVRLNKIAGAIL